MKLSAQLATGFENVVGKPVWAYDIQVGVIESYDSETGIAVFDIDDKNAEAFKELFGNTDPILYKKS